MNKQNTLINYFIFYVATLSFFAVGAITTLGLDWYRTIILPAFALQEFTVAVVWAALFMLVAGSMSMVWNVAPRNKVFTALTALYMGNGLLVLLWNYLFFGAHQLSYAAGAAGLVLLSVVALLVLTWKISSRASLLLAPYFAWMLYAVYFCYQVTVLNT